MKTWLIVALLLTGLTACSDAKRQQQLKKADELLQRVELVESTFQKEKNDTLGRLITSVMDIEFRIRNNFYSDTIAVTLGPKIDAFKSVRKRVRPIGKMHQQLREGTVEEAESLKKLKSDIENGLGKSSKYDKYLTFEENKVKQLEAVLHEMQSEQTACLEIYQKYHDELYALSWKLYEMNKDKLYQKPTR